MSKRKILLLALALSLVAILAVGGTLAYFTADDQAQNTFTVGNVKIDLTEPNWEKTGEAEAEDAYPGEPLAKDPTVENIGANPCFVRVLVSDLEQFGTEDNQLIKFRNAEGKLQEANAGWTYTGKNDDGQYVFYYNTVLEAGATTTTPAFSHVVMPTSLTNEQTDADYSINVLAQAVQAQGARPAWAAVQQMTVEEIAAWFDVCMK